MDTTQQRRKSDLTPFNIETMSILYGRRLTDNIPLSGSSVQQRDTNKNKLGKTYVKEIDTHLKDSNAFGNIYFSKYFEWQGVCRESFFVGCVSPDILGSGLKPITKNANIEFVKELFPFQKVRAELNVTGMGYTWVTIETRFYNAASNELAASGTQKIVFANMQNKLMKIPLDMKNKIKDFWRTNPS